MKMVASSWKLVGNHSPPKHLNYISKLNPNVDAPFQKLMPKLAASSEAFM